MLSKILDKFGIYDLVGVLLSGISISTLSLLVLQLVYGIQVNIELHVSETLSFLVISYFLGLIFQELGSFVQKKITHTKNALLEEVLVTGEEVYKDVPELVEKLNSCR